MTEATQFLGHLELFGHANFSKRGIAAKADNDKVTRTLSYYTTKLCTHTIIFSHNLGLKFILCWIIFLVIS